MDIRIALFLPIINTDECLLVASIAYACVSVAALSDIRTDDDTV